MNQKIKTMLFLLGFVVIMSLYHFWEEYHRNEMLKIGNETFGVIVSIDPPPVHGSPSAKIAYTIKHKKYVFDEDGSFSFMELGDTVLIRYALKDYSVAKVVDKYYMKKYKYLREE
ncbi:hypothetical protein [Fluviicola sp.]|uniref:hypothetical protein n=1 Tax=Fluviicola sp. TaxID=1917219 RepID=UPI0031D9941C